MTDHNFADRCFLPRLQRSGTDSGQTGLKSLILASALATSFVSVKASATAEMYASDQFSAVTQAVEQLTSGTSKYSNTLIVMDDDDTLTMMECQEPGNPKKCQYLGGPAWYDWQSGLLGSNSPFKVASDKEELLNINTLLLSINNMPYTDQAIPSILNKLSYQGSQLLVLTARGSETASATANQFASLPTGKNVSYDHFQDLISQNALHGKHSNISSIASPFLPDSCQALRPVSYQQGVMYIAGQNKGHMLLCLLQRTQSEHISNIVFIDDTLKNVEDVYTTFENSTRYRVKAIHYTALQQHKAALTEGPNSALVQGHAHNRWLKIRHTLKAQLKQPAAISTPE